MDFNKAVAYSTLHSVENFIKYGWPSWLNDVLKTRLIENKNIFQDLYAYAHNKDEKRFLLTMNTLIGTNYNTNERALIATFFIKLLTDHNNHNALIHTDITNTWIKYYYKNHPVFTHNTTFLNTVNTNVHHTLYDTAQRLIAKYYTFSIDNKGTDMGETDNVKCSIEKTNTKLFELVPTVNGYNAENMTDAVLLEKAAAFRNKIDHAKSLNIKSTKLDANIKAMETELAELIKYIDERPAK